MQGKKKIFTIVFFAFAGAHILTFTHGDSTRIMEWAKLFLDSLFSGNIRNYAEVLLDKDIPSNYSIFIHIINSIWVLPVYGIDTFIDGDIPLYVYSMWHRVLSVLLTFITMGYIEKIGIHFGVSREKMEVATFFYGISTPLIVGTYAMGQIDAYPTLFMVMGLYYLLEEKTTESILSFSVILFLKPFAFMYIAPMLLLYFADKWKKAIPYGVLVGIVWIVKKLVTKIFIGYGDMVYVEEVEWDHLSFFFTSEINVLPLFVLTVGVVLCICFVKGMKGKVKEWDYIYYPYVVFLAFVAFNFWNPQWFLYGMPFITIILCKMCNEAEAMAFGAGINGAYLLFNYCAFNGMVESNMIAGGLIAKTSGIKWKSASLLGLIANKMPTISGYITSISLGILVACMIYVCYATRKETLEAEVVDASLFENKKKAFLVLFVMISIFMIIYSYFELFRWN
ncbi:MAG: hypothetical protein K5675_07185 [Lachnospiraceae bacterium]|nr:hypothetical protein [Lachnospiraceae bacterium]